MGKIFTTLSQAATRCRQRLLAVQLLLFGLFLLFPVVTAAASISVGYTTNQSLPTGTIVAPDNQSNGAVVPANSGANNGILGVVVVDSTLAVSQANTKVQITTDGIVNVLVSDINGSVANGDQITTSPLDGIGMKATESGKVLGTVQGDLTSQSPGVQHKTVTDKQGQQKQVLIGLVPLTINISYYQPGTTSQTAVPKIIRDLSTSVSGKQVSTARIWSCMIILLVALLIVIVLLYGAVRTAVGAIGRNPLAKSAIQRTMARVIVIAVFILATAALAVFLILKG